MWTSVTSYDLNAPWRRSGVPLMYGTEVYISGAPRAPKALARGTPLLRKYGNPSMQENLVLKP